MKKSLKYLILIFMLFVLIRLTGLTYGFYETLIIGNKNDTSANVNSKNLSVLYTDGTSKMNFNGDYLFPGDSAEKSFTVTNTGDSKVSYSIILDNVVNAFERIQDLRYFIYINETLVDEGAINNNEVQYLYYREDLEVNSIDNIKFVFKYSETEESQNIDMNKEISFRVNIKGDVKTIVNSTSNTATVFLNTATDTLNNYRIYGNSIQDGTPTLDNPIEIESVGDLVTDETDTNYGKYKIPITVSGKNMINGINAESGYWFDSAGSASGSDSRFIRIAQIKVLPNVTYTFSSNLLTYTIWYFNYGESLSRAFYYSSQQKYHTFTTPENCNYLRITLYNTSGEKDTTALEWLQLEEGSSATDYEPYVEPTTTNIYLDEPLRKVGNYVDYLDLKEQRVVRNVSSLNLAIANMNNWSDDFPGWKNLTEIQTEFPNQNTVLEKVTSYKINTSPGVSDMGINTMNNNGQLWMKTSVYGLTQSEWKEQYPDLVVSLQYGKSSSSKQINVPSIALHDGTNIISVGTSTSPSGIEVNYYKK